MSEVIRKYTGLSLLREYDILFSSFRSISGRFREDRRHEWESEVKPHLMQLFDSMSEYEKSFVHKYIHSADGVALDYHRRPHDVRCEKVLRFALMEPYPSWFSGTIMVQAAQEIECLRDRKERMFRLASYLLRVGHKVKFLGGIGEVVNIEQNGDVTLNISVPCKRNIALDLEHPDPTEKAAYIEEYERKKMWVTQVNHLEALE